MIKVHCDVEGCDGVENGDLAWWRIVVNVNQRGQEISRHHCCPKHPMPKFENERRLSSMTPEEIDELHEEREDG